MVIQKPTPMIEESINLLEEINHASKIHRLQPDDIDGLMIEFGKRISFTLRIERISIWLFNEQRDAIVSIGEYDLAKREFTKGNTLLKSAYPMYFKAISENKILLAPNIITNENTRELAKDYSKPNNLISLMDIPLRVEGELIGVICFEKTGTEQRIFTDNEQIFAMSIAMVLASTLEARKRRALQHLLKEELKEKEILIKEIHHRVKNNLAVVSSLINLQASKAMDGFHKILFDECRNKISTIAKIHEEVYKSNSFASVNLKDYFENVLTDLQKFYSNNGKTIELKYTVEPVNLEPNYVLPLSLIVNEVVTNSYKHAFAGRDNGKIEITIKLENKKVALTIIDNGTGFNETVLKPDSLGIEIIRGLAEQLNAEFNYSSYNGTVFSLSFTLAH